MDVSELDQNLENAMRQEMSELQFSTVTAQAAFCQTGNEISRSDHGKAICTASSYEYDSIEDLHASPYWYRRLKSPNSDDLAHAIASLESAEAGLATSSGMGAVVSGLLCLMKAGDTVLAHSDTYGGTFSFLELDVRRFGMNVEFVDVLDVGSLESTLSILHKSISEIADNSRKLVVFCESITNPLLRVADVPAISSVCKKFGAILIVDNTFGTPLRTKPLLQGADIVIHSATKFLGGHHDLMAGALVGPAKYVDGAKQVAARWGLTISAFDAWLCTRSIRTLQVRLERSWITSERLAELMKAEKDSVLRVYSAAKCAVFSFLVVGGMGGASRALRALRLIKLAPSLGGVTTTVSHPASTSHASLGVEERERLGILDGLIRISVGLEHEEDLWKDLSCALDAVAAGPDATVIQES